MFKKIAGSVAALTLAVAGVGFLGTAAHAQSDPVRSTGIAPTETSDNYTVWHQGATPGGRYASTLDGLIIEGKTQIIKGETTVPAASDLLAYAQSSTIEATGGPVWHQIGFGFADGSFTTLRALKGQESGDWTTSKALNGVAANGSAPLTDLLGGLTGELTYLSGGFYVDTNERSIVQSYSVNAVATSFALSALDPNSAVEEIVLSESIRPNEAEYLGWHDGAPGTAGAPLGTFVSTPAGLVVEGKVQILNGQESSGDQIAEFVSGLAIEAQGDDVWFQVPVMGATGFTTLRATPADAATGMWTTSRALGDLGANTQAHINEIALQLGSHEIIGYGFFVDAGKSATVRSITANGTRTLFTSPNPFTPRTDVPGSGLAAGTVETQQPSSEKIQVAQGAKVSLSTPEGIFEPGETVTVTLFSNNTQLGSLTAQAVNGVVAGDVTVPADAKLGEYRVLLQGAHSHFWAPATYVVVKAGTDGEGSGGGKGSGVVNGPGGDKGAASGKGLAATGSGSGFLPAALAGSALLLGAGLLLTRRRAVK